MQRAQKRPKHTQINEKRPVTPEQMKRDLYIPEYMERELWAAQRHLRDDSSLFAWECTKETYIYLNK